MPIFKLFILGLRLGFRKWRLAARLWAVNFLFSLLVVAPLAWVIHSQLIQSLSADAVLAKPDIHWLTDLSTRYMSSFPMIVGWLLAAVILYMLLSVFLNGGVIGCLNRPEARTTLADFFHDCGLHFWRFFRLFLLSLPIYLLTLGLLFPLVKALLEFIDRRATTEWPVIVLSHIRILSLLLLLGIVAMFFDYVKIGLVAGSRRKVLMEAWQTLKLVGRRFFKAWGLYLLAGLAFILLTAAYLEVVRLLPKGRPLMILLVFLWQQFYMLGRQVIKVLFFASELEFWKQYQAPARSL